MINHFIFLIYFFAEFGYILSRKPTLDAQFNEKINSAVERAGFKREDFQKNVQDCWFIDSPSLWQQNKELKKQQNAIVVQGIPTISWNGGVKNKMKYTIREERMRFLYRPN